MLFIALSYGVIPLNHPQRTEITDFQRELVNEIQNIELEKLGTVFMENLQEVVNLFSIIHKFPFNRIQQQDVSSGSKASTQRIIIKGGGCSGLLFRKPRF